MNEELKAKSLINSFLYIAALRQGRIFDLVKRRCFKNKIRRAAQRARLALGRAASLVAHRGVSYPTRFSEGRPTVPPIRQSSKLKSDEPQQTAQREDCPRVLNQQGKGSRGSPRPRHACTHTNTHPHTCTHTYKHIHMSKYAYTNPYKHTFIQIHTWKYIHTYKRTHVHTNTHSSTCIRAYIKQIPARTYCLPATVRSL